MRTFVALLTMTMISVAGVAQQAATAPSNAPSLQETMKFIQERMNAQGLVAWMVERSWDGVKERHADQLSDVVADPATCTLAAKKIHLLSWEGGSFPDEKSRHQRSAETSVSSFKDVERITVESLQDVGNHSLAEAGHADFHMTLSPTVFAVTLGAAKPAFQVHATMAVGNDQPTTTDQTFPENSFKFRDEEMANRVAKAMARAVELCGGKPEVVLTSAPGS